MWLVAYFLSRCGSVTTPGEPPGPPTQLGVNHWKEAYRLFYDALGDGRTPESFDHSLKNARDGFDGRLNSGRTGWREGGKDRPPITLNKYAQSKLPEWQAMSDDALWQAVQEILNSPATDAKTASGGGIGAASFVTGKLLNEQWKIGAKQAYFRSDGTYFHRLKEFPGALCDAEGYILFSTEAEYVAAPFLITQGKNVACKAGIRTQPSYVLCTVTVAADIGEPSPTQRVEQRVSRIIRDTALARELKLKYDHHCQICGHRVEINGRGYCEAHHIRPLGSPHNGPDHLSNLICVCPNCHVLLDYEAMPITSSALKISKHQIAEAYINHHNSRCRHQASERSTKP